MVVGSSWLQFYYSESGYSRAGFVYILYFESKSKIMFLIKRIVCLNMNEYWLIFYIKNNINVQRCECWQCIFILFVIITSKYGIVYFNFGFSCLLCLIIFNLRSIYSWYMLIFGRLKLFFGGFSWFIKFLFLLNYIPIRAVVPTSYEVSNVNKIFIFTF